jgi:acyl-CoA thioesterase
MLVLPVPERGGDKRYLSQELPMPSADRQKRINAYVQNDPFARSLGAKVEILAPGHSRASLTITEEMTNFHGITHGGVIFALGDMAFAAAGNSSGRVAVALNVNICFLKASRAGDHLVAEAREMQPGGKTALFGVTVTESQSGDIIAQSQDLLFRKRDWFVAPED